jgi:hypothetical protein
MSSQVAQLRVQALQLYRTADQLYAVNKIDAANVIYDRYLGVQHKYKAEAYLERLPMQLLSLAEHLISRKS